MVYSSFYFLELKEVQDCTEYRFEIFSFARVSPHAVVGPSPSEKKKKNHGRSIIHWAFSFQKLAPTPTFEAVDVIYSYIYSSYFYLALNEIIDFVRNFSVFGVIEYLVIICWDK